ncbi:MAG: restriction endonuclease subunit S, partial [Ruminococcus sp.]|nr:restriction endonuclease subunit S [Ruminococcus sp.]
MIEENQKPVPKPDGEYIRLGIRSHAKGTFHEVVAEGEGLDVDTMYVVEANNLIVNITFAWEEAWAITTEKDAEKLVSHRFPQYRFHHGQYPMFYQYRFRNGRMKYNLELASPGGAGRNRVLNKTEFMKIPVIIPTSYEEEKKIGDLFTNLDNLITLHQRECFSFDFGSRSAKVAQKTISWEQRKFSELTEIRSASRVHKDEWQSSGVPFYRSSDVMAALNGTENEKAFISEELYEKLSAVSGKLEKGDVLVTGGGSVGKPYIVPNNEPLYTKDADLLWIKNNENLDPYFVYTFFFSPTFTDYLNSVSHVGTIAHYTITQLGETPITLPCVSEQQKIGDYFRNLDFLITLHQREPPKEDKILNDIKTDTLFHEYYCQWLVIYKEGSVRGVTMQKYHLTAEWVKKLIPDVKLCDFD